jgi:hypothetical protein
LQVTRIIDLELAKSKEILVQYSVQHFFELCLKSFLSSYTAVSLSIECSFVVLFLQFLVFLHLYCEEAKTSCL